jgi:uncharacterized protein YkwD
MRGLLFIILGIILQSSSFISLQPRTATVCLTPEEQKLYELMMDYRESKGLGRIPVSAKLTLVAQTHAKDLAENYKFDPENKCNPHSWSRKGSWSSCCYTNDHRQAKCMWDKPKEIAAYEGTGYEIAYYSSNGARASEGLEGWQKSKSHNPLIINDGMWQKAKWKAIGIGFYKEYGVVWFGEVVDDSTASQCVN